jgi:hypothetical protein
MAQVRHNQARFNLDGHPCVRCTPELDFLRGEPGCVLMGDFLDDTSLSNLDMKLFVFFGFFGFQLWSLILCREFCSWGLPVGDAMLK